MKPREGSLASRILDHMKDHPVPWRAKPLAEALDADPNIVSTVLSQIYDEGKGPLTRCEVSLIGTNRKVFEYRIGAGAGGSAMPAATWFGQPGSLGQKIVRRDEGQAPIPSSHGRRPAVEDGTPQEEKTRKTRRRKSGSGKRVKPARKGAKPAPKGARKAKRQPRAAKLRATAATPVTQTPARSFRCALYSDGSLAIECGAESIELLEPETRHLFTYLECMVRDLEAREEAVRKVAVS